MKNDNKIISAEKAIKKVTYQGMVINIVLSVFKIIFGVAVNSLSLVSDGFHSLSDLATDVAVLVGIKFSAKKPDKDHPYGHGRSETFATFMIALALIAVGCFMIYYAAIDLAKGIHRQPSVVVFLIATISVISKEFLYRITKKIAFKLDSSMLYANAWHHRSDAFSSIAVIAGYFAYFMNFYHGDQVAAIIVAVMIIGTAAAIFGKCIREISEASADSKTIEQINKILQDDNNISHWHNLRTRLVGREIFMDLHILVDTKLDILQAHQISENLETMIHSQIKRPINITVHIEPDIEEFRK